MKFRLAALLGVVVALLIAAPAYATDTIPVESTCLTGWYVNGDEQDLLPKSTADGMAFDGPSIVHHTTDMLLTGLQPGFFELEDDAAGSEPLFKVETSPYSTLNLADFDANLWWSSRIPAGEQGGQGQPVTPAVMATLPISDKSWDDATSYTAQTKVISFGVGYASDEGNHAVVTQITFGGDTYMLTCKPSVTPAATTPPATNPATAEPSTTVAAGEETLPKTGAGVATVAGIGGAVVLVGAALLVGARRRRARFTA